MNQRARSSEAWFKRLAVWALSTPSRCWRGASKAEGSDVLIWPSDPVTKFTRSTPVLEEIHDSLFGHPPTPGGSNSDWPIPAPAATMSFDDLAAPSACAAWTMNSVGLLTSVL